MYMYIYLYVFICTYICMYQNKIGDIYIYMFYDSYVNICVQFLCFSWMRADYRPEVGMFLWPWMSRDATAATLDPFGQFLS